jgi:hypothetical protein
VEAAAECCALPLVDGRLTGALDRDILPRDRPYDMHTKVRSLPHSPVSIFVRRSKVTNVRRYADAVRSVRRVQAGHTAECR